MPDHSTTHSRQRERDATDSEGISVMGEALKVPTKKERTVKVKYSRIKRKILSHVTAVRSFLVVTLLLILGILGFFVVREAKVLNVPMYFNVVYNFATAPVGQLAAFNGRTNILVMGKAGGVHDGPDLTDTMMLVSVSLTDRNVKIISIPRDIWIPEIRAKINSAYYWGNQKDVGGINFAKAITSEVVGVPIQYGTVIDFSGFKDIIDELGGIQVDVANSFTDYFYPIVGLENDTCNSDPLFMCRYETLTFNAGLQTMSGETALKFVRSRHAEGIEGTDIAREARQQKVIDAIKNKLIDKSTYANPKKDLAILRVILNSVQTDLDYPTAAIIARRVYDSKNSVGNYLIPDTMLINPPVSSKYDMQSVFIPKEGNGKWQNINAWVEGILK